ncbi:hypothetical protein ABW19_dt0204167 [Dactylella cylindrospora]|nr:hypothetical protein ABW19_dt0204167 [Dactylella cylindrospora]
MSSPSPGPSGPLQNNSDTTDVEELQKQIRELTKIRNERQAELLSLRSTHTLKEILESASNQTLRTSIPNSGSGDSALEIEDANLNEILLKQASDLATDRQEWLEESMYRMAGLTSFTVQDPAPGGGELTGVRIEVMADGKFGTPYYLFLKPYDTTPKPTATDPFPAPSTSPTHLTLHRHTIPAYFLQSLTSLCEKHLPPPPTLQNANRLIRDVRRIVVLHHLRLSHLSKIKEKVTQNLPGNHPTPSEVPQVYISEFTIDPEARLVEVEWLDGKNFGTKRLGWIALTEEGGAEGVVVKKDGQRVMAMERQIRGDWVRGGSDGMHWIDGLFGRLEWTV